MQLFISFYKGWGKNNHNSLIIVSILSSFLALARNFTINVNFDTYVTFIYCFTFVWRVQWNLLVFCRNCLSRILVLISCLFISLLSSTQLRLTNPNIPALSWTPSQHFCWSSCSAPPSRWWSTCPGRRTPPIPALGMGPSQTWSLAVRSTMSAGLAG